MTPPPEKLYSTRETASELGLGTAMLRRYASTYETVSGDAITLHPRDGRLFTEAQVNVLTQARALVMQTSVDVETAVKQALQQPLQLEPVALAQSSALSSEGFIAALTAAQERANAPLLGELQGIRAALERLEAAQPETSTQVNLRETLDDTKHGPVVRVALWLERVLKRAGTNDKRQ